MQGSCFRLRRVRVKHPPSVDCQPPLKHRAQSALPAGLGTGREKDNRAVSARPTRRTGSENAFRAPAPAPIDDSNPRPEAWEPGGLQRGAHRQRESEIRSQGMTQAITSIRGTQGGPHKLRVNRAVRRVQIQSTVASLSVGMSQVVRCRKRMRRTT